MGRELVFSDGVVRRMQTVSVDPPIFEISDYLSAAECDRLVLAADAKGYASSSIRHFDMDWVIDSLADELLGKGVSKAFTPTDRAMLASKLEEKYRRSNTSWISKEA